MAVNRADRDRPLDQLPYITRETDAGYMAQLTRWMNENGLRPSDRLIISDVPTVVTLVEQGIGWAVLPTVCLKKFDGVARPMFFKDGRPFTRRTHILYRREQYALPQVRAFIETALRQEAEEQNT